MSDDPTAVRSVAVTRDDVVRALELQERGGPRAVLRVTPPFAGRMRARLHVEGREGEYDDPEPLHLSPRDLVRDPPPFPGSGSGSGSHRTEDTRGEPGRDAVETERRHHERAVEGWRRAVAARLVETTTVETPVGPHRVDVAVLG